MADVEILDETHHWEHEAAYLEVRRAEGRLLTDDQVRALPQAPNGQDSLEWRIRDHSLVRLERKLRRLPPPRIFELGCGNGWLANRLAEIAGALVTGLDLNRHELAQAARVFGERNNLHFAYGNIMTTVFTPESFDVIVLASVIQYFPEPKNLMRKLLPLLSAGGEIHILDSPLYPEEAVPAAAARTQEYFLGLSLAAAPRFYHHHKRRDLDEFRPQTLHEPSSLKAAIQGRLLRQPLSPFPWLRIRK